MIEFLEEAFTQARADAGVRQAGANLAAGIQIYFSHGYQTENVQADYVGLFELNREQPPVYLLQHRYNRETHATQVDLYKPLLERYRSCGITLKQGEGAVSPDQLSVQLEFIGYLCGYLAHASAGDDLAMPRVMLTDTVRMLHWIEGPIERIVQADVQHPVYLPLLRFMRCALDLFATTTSDVD